MERLTKKFMDKYILPMMPISPFLDINEINKFHEVRREYEANTIRLGEYEDTGLTPEEIKDILSVLSENQDDEDEDGISTGIIHDLLELARYRQAEEQGLLHKAKIQNGTVIYAPATSPLDDDEYIYHDSYLYGVTEYIIGEINKDWFLTREEAEQALKGAIHE